MADERFTGRWKFIQAHPVLPFLILFILVFFLSFASGRYPVDPVTLVKVLISRIADIPQTWPDQAETVIFRIRLPRVLIGALIAVGIFLVVVLKS